MSSSVSAKWCGVASQVTGRPRRRAKATMATALRVEMWATW
jgi:hypothetical protein